MYKTLIDIIHFTKINDRLGETRGHKLKEKCILNNLFF